MTGYKHAEPKCQVQQKALSTRGLAQLHAIRMGLDGDDFATFMNLFDRFRSATLRGADTYGMWRTILNDPDGSLATAAYLEGVASTRKLKDIQ